MNSDEAIALGAGYIGASKSSEFIMTAIRTKPFVGINVSLQTGTGLRELFATTSRTTDEVVLPFGLDELRPFAIVVGDSRVKLQTFEISLPDAFSDKDEVAIAFGFNQLLVPIVINATINGSVLLKVAKTDPEWMMSPDELRESKAFLRKMDSLIESRRKAQQARSDFEAYIYKTKERLEHDDVFKSVITGVERKNITGALKTALDWFESCQFATVKEIEKQKTALKKSTRDAERRADQIVKLPPALKTLNTTLTQIWTSLNKTWPAFRPYLPVEDVERLTLLYNTTKAWFDEISEQVAKAKPTDNPVVLDEAIIKRNATITKLYKQLLAIEKPKPTPKPKAANNTTKTVNETADANTTRAGNETAENGTVGEGEATPAPAPSDLTKDDSL
jgi:hypothetical protein